MIFVDTGAWFARFVPEDAEHERMTAWFDANHEPLVTTDYCVDETLTLLAMRGRPRLAAEAGRLFFDESFGRLHFLARAQIEKSWILFQQRVSSGWSFTDCTSKVVIDELKLESAVAVDRHFEQFGVQILPA